MPRSLRFSSAAQTRLGSAPTPICRQAPSGTRPAMMRLITSSSAAAPRDGSSSSATWFSTIASTSETCSSAPSPRTRGIFSLTSTMSRLAERANLGRVIVAGAECEIAVAVHRRDGADEGVDADLFGQQSRRLMKVIGNVVDDLTPAILHATLDEGAFGSTDKHAIGNKSVIELITQYRPAGDTGRFEIIEPDILDFAGLGAVRQGLQERRRLGHCHAQPAARG